MKEAGAKRRRVTGTAVRDLQLRGWGGEPEDTRWRKGTRHFGEKEEEESAEVRGVPQKKSRREGRRKASERNPTLGLGRQLEESRRRVPDPCRARPGAERGTHARRDLPLQAPARGAVRAGAGTGDFIHCFPNRQGPGTRFPPGD